MKEGNTTEKIRSFTELHHQNHPLLIGNIWDAFTAKIAQEAGYKTLGTSSHAIAFSLGYKDGEQIPLDDLLFVIERIMKVAEVPVSVDFEAGYSDSPEQVARNVKRLTDEGVVGINLEDGKVINGERKLQDADILISKIKAIKESSNIFINARTDTYTTKHPRALKETLHRSKLYGKAGADGIFVPLIETESDLKAFLEEVKLPLNVFTTPELPDYKALTKLGVHRISHGAKQYEHLMKISKGIFTDFLGKREYSIVLGD